MASLLADLQQALAHFTIANSRPVFIFLDDVHYLARNDVPELLDMLHGLARDNPVWLKVAGIKHQTRWFSPEPPTGLQTGHDATIIDLDVTLEEPARAREFLRNVLQGYLRELNALPMSNFLPGASLDRLLLASGGVPRDFLTLCAASIQLARQRTSASTLGVQDVNKAAGLAAQTKLQELEEDAAADHGRSQELVNALNTIRDFLLSEKHFTFFRIDYRDKELRPDDYALIQSLADLRMLHLINSSLSAAHEAGRRSEVYLLDLSQYSASRLKQGLHVLDFLGGRLLLKKTRGGAASHREGDTPRKLVGLLRRGPLFALERLSGS